MANLPSSRRRFMLNMTNNSVLGLLWSRFTWRHWRRSSLSSVLLLLLLGIGIGAFFSIRLANRAALAGFEQFKLLIASNSDGTITAATGLIPDSALAEIRAALGPRPVALVPVL